MPAQTESIRAALAAGTSNLRLHFDANDAGVLEAGTQLTKADSSRAPVVSIGASAGAASNKRYVVACLDLDAPYPGMPFMGPIQHYLAVGVKAVPATGAAGWFDLRDDGNDEAAAVLMPYIAPAPPPLSGPHRYLYMVWAQPVGLTGADARAKLGLPKNPGLMARTRFDEGACEKLLAVGDLVASTFFTV